MAGFFPVLKIDDFVLRELSDDDLEAISRIWGSPNVAEKLSSGPLTHDDSVQMLYVLRSLWENDAGIRWGVVVEVVVVVTASQASGLTKKQKTLT